ncbi:MAG TPA: 3-oxoacyl-ACP reductase [Solirubrobacteraceae bacterium]|nr:3-oxoacyl-ACP reductase [Solirubrobacteraceae bacterium]
MSDRYQQLVNTPIGRIVSKQIGLPSPVPLERYEPGQPVIDGAVLLGAAPGGRLAGQLARVLQAIEAETYTPREPIELREAAADAGLDAGMFNPQTAGEDDTFKAVVFDASGIASTAELREAWAFFGPAIRRVRGSGRVIVFGTPPEDCSDSAAHVAQRALEGLTRSMAKEVRRGATGQLVYVRPGAEAAIESTLRFLLSPRSAYVSGQVIRISGRYLPPDAIDYELPLTGKVALVTGASRGIGEAIAEVLARDGAHVVGVDVPAMSSELDAVTSRIGGSALALDITDPSAPDQIVSHLVTEHGGVDAVVHNAGITRDKTLGRMSDELWDTVLAVNLIAPERITAALLERDAIRPNGRVVGVSSISGIAGNAGQTNYATSKAGVIGLVETLAPAMAERQSTINAVAPGFIETRMTQAMPIATREAGRRMNSLAQGGLPIDVAETIAWFASPGSSAVNGNVVRVCGQSLIGA